MKVNLIKPPQVQNMFRGVGVYEENLIQNLKKISGLEITNENPDLTHFLYFDPFFLTLPLWRATKTIVTVFDLTPIVLENLFPRGIKGEIKWQIQKNLLKTVDHIITISESAKKDIVRIIGIPAEKVTVTYLAAGKDYKNLKLKRENFVLYIGDINPNKNISSLFKAIALLKNEKLVLVGKALSESMEIRKEINILGIKDRVKFAGYISEKEKIILLNKAKVYVQPSIYEGFGLPILEAMACNCPVICGRNSSLIEIAGDAATHSEVTDINDLSDKIKNVKATEKEIIQARKFSWEKTATETVKIYEKILAGC